MKFLNNKKNRWRVIFLGFIGLLLLGSNSHIKVVRYHVTSTKIHEPIKMVLITDLHSCYYGDEQKDLLKILDEEKPDLVLYSGDIFDDQLDKDNAWKVVESLAKQYPSYYVSGNHEVWGRDLSEIKLGLKNLGVHVLEGDVQRVTIGQQQINICGVDDPSINGLSNNQNLFLKQLEKIQESRENGIYSLLLSHRPEYVDTYVGYGFDLILSGHAHGGQWRIPGILNGLYAPNQGLFPKYAGGRYVFLASEMIVSRGLAKETTRVPRLFNRPELVVIELE